VLAGNIAHPRRRASGLSLQTGFHGLPNTPNPAKKSKPARSKKILQSSATEPKKTVSLTLSCFAL
jgi:hypothetical protein